MNTDANRPSQHWLQFAHFLATVCFVGYIPEKLGLKKGRGAGLSASLFTFLFIQLPMIYAGTSGYMALVIFVFSVIVGYFIIPTAENYMRSMSADGKRTDHTGKKTGHDFNENCWDELVGMLFLGVVVMGLPAFYPSLTKWDQFTMLFMLGFWFRIFDAYKPLGIKWFEKKLGKGPTGIMGDDIVAGIYTLASVAGTLYAFSSLMKALSAG